MMMRGTIFGTVTLRGTAFGNLYLTEKKGDGRSPTRTRRSYSLLAAQAAVAIENARLYESANQWSRQLESLNEVSEALATEADLSQLFQLAATRLRELLDAPGGDGAGPDIGWVVSNGRGRRRRGRFALLGLKLGRERSKSGRTLARRRGERIDSLLDDPEVDQTAPRLVEATSALYVPLIVRGRGVGVIVAYDKQGVDHRFSDSDMRIGLAFANRAALALDLSERVGREAVRALVSGQEQNGCV